MSYTPALPPGQATSVASAPVVPASDAIHLTDLDVDRVLHDIAIAVREIATARGIAADLRVFVDNVPAITVNSGTVTTVTTVTTCSTLSTITNIPTIGSLATGPFMQNEQNNAYSNTFSQNIIRP